MRIWLKQMDEMDRDCVHHYEWLLGRKLEGIEEYRKIDSLVDEMVLDFETREDFFRYYTELKETPTFRVTYEERIIHTFEIVAASAKAARARFEQMKATDELDFSDGYFEDSKVKSINKIRNQDENRHRKNDEIAHIKNGEVVALEGDMHRMVKETFERYYSNDSE